MQAKWQQNATCTLFAQVNAGFTANTNEKTVDSFRDNGFYLVAWDGIEPSTRGFSIRCSTN
jgi:hypothetical protein